MARVVVSLVIGAVLALQAAASFAVLAPLTGRGAHWLWPFLDYPMYARAYYEGAQVDQPAVVGTLPDGREVPVGPEDLGLNFWRFHYGVVETLRRGDTAALAVHADLYRARRGTPLARLRLESRPLVVTRHGVRPGAPSILAEAELPGERAVSRAWYAYWFRPAPLLDLAVVRIVAVGFQLSLLLGVDHHALFAELDGLPAILYEPLAALRVLTLPFGWRVRPAGDVLHVVYWAAIAAGVLALAGWRTNATLAAFGLGNVLILAYRYSFGEIHHPEALMMLALGLLALSPAGARLSVDDLRRRLAAARRERRAVEADPLGGESPFARWPLLTVRWLFALIYLSAAWSKLATAGLDWANGYTLQFYMLRDGLRWGSSLGVWLGEQHVVALLASVGALLFEATFWVVLVLPALALVYVPAGIGLHTGIYLVQRAPFFQFVALYAVFVPWTTLVGLLRRRAAGRVEVLYDDHCPFCIRTVTVLRAIDWGDRLVLGGLEARWPALAAARRDLSLDECRREMHLLLPDGSVRRGFDAFREIARLIPLLWPAWVLFCVPGVPTVGRRVYRWVAARRVRVAPCTFEACAVEERGARR